MHSLSPAVTLVVLALAASSAKADLRTHAERTGYAETGRYDEVRRLCRDFAARFPGKIRCQEIGVTPEGRPMVALVASADGKLEPAKARAAGRPALFFIGGIHAGEIDGKDAGFALLADLMMGKGPHAALSAVTVVFVPVFNVDGHERFGPNQRPNQRGPRATGFRTTAQNLNLNRDWLKADAPEMAHLLALFSAWDPALLVDLHATDGAKFEHDVAVVVDPRAGTDEALIAAAGALSARVMAGLSRRGHLPLPFYPAFRKHEDPTSGIEVAPSGPRFSTSYVGWRNRIGVLVETHSWRTYPERVRATRAVLEEILLASEEGGAKAWQAAGRAADQATARLAGRAVTLDWNTVAPARTLDFRGYAFTREPSPIAGGTVVRYDEGKPAIWKVEVWDRLAPALTVTAPRGGYVVPAAHAALVAPKLALHGLSFERVREARAAIASEVFRADDVVLAKASFEGRVTAQLRGQWRAERRAIPAGSLYVPIAQAGAPLLLQLFEPTSPESLAAWGFFHAAFEQKEYMEDYVADEEARKMIARDPALGKAFEKELAADPALARNPERRLRWFYRRHPAWDERVNLYPILRVAARP